jgi:murein DD-endopeptidase MepM/ murein hydrolase activator NlpD
MAQAVRTRGRRGTSVLDQGKRRGGYRLEAEHIDLGNEAPLSVDGENSGLVDRRRVSVQWFSGTILTGLCGAALMGGAVFAALDGETNFATVPERVEATLRAVSSAGERLANAARKADRLPPPGEANATRQVIPMSVSTTLRGSGNREVVRARQFVRVAGNLSLSLSELSAGIPPFNALKMLARSDGAAAADDAAGAEPDAEVSFVTRDLATALPRAKLAAATGLDEILARVREAANWGSNAGQKPGLITGSIPSMAYAPERPSSDPYAGFEPRIVPENITLLPKTTTTQATGGNAWGERTFQLKKGDSVAAILRELGATAEEIKAIAAAFGRGKDTSPRDGYKLRVLLAPAGGGKRLQPVRVIIATDSSIDAMVAWSDKGKYVAVDVRSANTTVAASDDEEDDGKGVRLYHSIYETALRNQVPRPVIDDLIRIYSYDVDFQRKVQPGDSFEILFSGHDDAGSDSKGDVLFASLTTGGETRKFYRYQTTDDNIVDYYDESGKSAKKFLVRKPLAEGIVRSGFGSRNHPILGYMKMHTGIDWGAAMGTPIFASGNGTIVTAGWEGGYGKYIRIRHANGYETAYGHMSAFARGMEPGKKVRQGQVIGYVGSTGLSTGAHLHYEILINGRFVDPMKIKLPRGRVLEGPVLTAFETERSRLDNMITRGAPSRYADGNPPRR